MHLSLYFCEVCTLIRGRMYVLKTPYTISSYHLVLMYLVTSCTVEADKVETLLDLEQY